MPSPTDPPTTAIYRLPLFASVPADAMARFAGQVRWLVLRAGQPVVDFGDPTTDVYIVLEGAVRVLNRTADGEHTQILGDFAVGDIVGELSAIDGAPRSARVEALVRARLGVVPADAFLDLALGTPVVGLRIMRLLTGRIRAQNQRALEHTALPVRLRIAAELLRLCRPRPDGTSVISPPPIQEDLANRVGARRETVARELAAISRTGLLNRSRTAFLLPDPAALRDLVQHGRLDAQPGGTRPA